MNKLEFECEALTPLFLGGSENRVKPELRAPSVRGAMRYWYRAILGGSTLVSGGTDEEQLSKLKDGEAHIFGTQEEAASVAVIVKSRICPEVDIFQKDRSIRSQRGDYLPSGKDYLFWSMAASGKPDTDRYLPPRGYIKPGTKFTITLQAWRGNTDDKVKKAAAALWLLAHLGALGARANRCAGSIQVLLKDMVDEIPPFREYGSVDEMRSALSSGIRYCLSLVCDGRVEWRKFDLMPDYDVLAPGVAEIWVVSASMAGWSSWYDAINAIGERLRDYRSYSSQCGIGQEDHDAVLNWLQGGPCPRIKRAVFGLPLPFRYSEGGPADVIISGVGDRRASPLKMRITRLATGRYVGVLTLFKSRFLGDGQQLKLQTRKWEAPPPTDYKVIEDFIEKFELKWRIEL